MNRDDPGYDPWREYVAPIKDPHAGNRDRDGNVLFNATVSTPHLPSDREVRDGQRAASYRCAASGGGLGP